MTQKQRVLEHLQAGNEISSLYAVVYMGIMDLPKRISELRRGGYMTTRKWTDNNGVNRTVYEVKCENVEALTNAPQSTETINPYGNNTTLPPKINMDEIKTDENFPF